MSNNPQWWEITLGIILILIGISLFFLQKKSKQDVDFYKQRQLEQFKKENPKFKGNYEQSKLILPWSQRFKLTMWPLVGLAFIVVGITISTGLIFGFFIR